MTRAAFWSAGASMHIAAVNAFDTDRIAATFATDAYVNDNRREIASIDAIRDGKIVSLTVIFNQPSPY